MLLNRLQQVRGPPVMQEKDSLSYPPERRGPELSGARLSLRDSVGQPVAHVVDQHVGEQIRRLIAQRRDRGIAGRERGSVTESATDAAEQALAVRDRRGSSRRIGRRRRRREEAHEETEFFDVAYRVKSGRGSRIGDAVRNRRELAARSFIPLGLKQLVGDALLDVVRFAGEEEQRFVLRLPPKTRDRAVIAVVVAYARDRAAGSVEIRVAPDSQRALLTAVARHVGEDRAVRNLLDQARAEYRRGDPEDHVVVRELRREVRLRERAARRARPTCDGEESVHAAVRRSVGIPHEPRLAYRPVRFDKGGHEIGSAVLVGEGHLRIGRDSSSDLSPGQHRPLPGTYRGSW